MSSPLLRVEGLVTTVENGSGPRVPVIDGVSFDVRRGETLALVGESGCGKSMTALSLVRLLPDAAQAVAGRVLLEGVDLLGLPEAAMRDVRGRRMAMIFQEPGTSLNPVLTLGEQIGEVLRRHADPGSRATERSRVIELLQSVGIAEPAQRVDEYPFQLSGGMRQRAMIAMALALEPDVLIADEPTTALDVTIQAQVLELLRDLQRRRGTAIVLITHDLGVVASMADRIGVMYAGQLVEVATRKAFLSGALHPYSRKLLAAIPAFARRADGLAVIRGQVPAPGTVWSGCRFADRCEEVLSSCRDALPTLIGDAERHAVRCFRAVLGEGVDLPAADPTLMLREGEVRRDAIVAEALHAAAQPDARKPLLVLEGLRVHFPIRRGLLRRTVGHVRAVDGVSLEIGRGQTLALVGESGCGKTTVGKAILGLTAATAGRVCFDGEDLAQLGRSALRRYRRRVQIVFQDPFGSLDPRMQVSELVKEGLRAQSIGISEAERDARVRRLLDQVGLPASAMRRYPHEFSGGQRQRLAIARALAVEPDLIVCDEPTSALDVSVQAQVLNLLRELQRALGLSYLFITHNLAAVEFIADRVAVMYLGRIVEEGAVQAVLRDPRHPYTQALLSAVPGVGEQSDRIVLAGEIPSPVNPPSGCSFHPRCPKAQPACREQVPNAIRLADDHYAACQLLAPRSAL